MMAIGLAHYLTVGAILFTLGVLGIFLNRKNVIVILMSVELILLSVTTDTLFTRRLFAWRAARAHARRDAALAREARS